MLKNSFNPTSNNISYKQRNQQKNDLTNKRNMK